MVALSLDKIFNPKSIALIGASDEPGSVGYMMMKNLTELGYKGNVYPVNIRKETILGFQAYQTVKELPETVDLAIIAIPAKTVPKLVEECGQAGILGIIIISAGFRETGVEGKKLEDEIGRIRDQYNLRIIGPNCLGIINPTINLNATFATKMPEPGRIAFISQSGALGTAILDWAMHEKIGFSNFVSVGSMIDVNFGDLIDYFGTDPHTSSILMYIEGIKDARKFMSAARHFARTKPIIVIKSGKFTASAEAAASHTGSLTGEDVMYDAAFKRAGMVRVDEIGEIFNAAEVLDMQPLPLGPRLTIVTNAGGPGVMAADTLIAQGGQLAELSPTTLEKLDKLLPAFWSHGNPIDILGDAKAERYKKVLQICLQDENTDGLLIIYTPQGITDPAKIARSIVGLCKKKESCKTIITSFMGYEEVVKANRILSENDIPTYFTPEQGVRTYMTLYQYKRNLELLYETPEELLMDTVPPKRIIKILMRNAAKENRELLTFTEAQKLLEFYKIPVIETYVEKTVEDAVASASKIGYPVALKVVSPQIIHKTDAGGVKLNIHSEAEVKEAFEKIMTSVKTYDPEAQIEGIAIQRMVKERGYEVILGAKTDPVFGPAILFGMGGIGVELLKDFSIGLPPLNRTLAKRIMEETKIYQLLKGYRNLPPANLHLLEEIMVRFSQLLIDFPELKEIDINPLFVTGDRAFVLDPRIIIDKKKVFTNFTPHEHLVISPYPKKYETHWTLANGRQVLIRPIKPEDEPLWLEMFQHFSDESIRYRFFHIIKDTPHEMRIRYCNIDYDRELGLVAELTEDGKRRILGVVRLIIEPDGKTGEIAFIIGDPWQGLGLGTKMIDYMIEIYKNKNLKNIFAIMLPDNKRAIRLLRSMGFTIAYVDEDTVRASLDLNKEYS